MHFMRGLLRLAVVGFTVVSLLLVAAVGVSASSGRAGSDTLKNSVVALFSGHSEQTAAHHENGNGEGNGEGNGGGGDKCRPHPRHHHHATGDHENGDGCGAGSDDSGSD
jgi:hypothetical protein